MEPDNSQPPDMNKALEMAFKELGYSYVKLTPEEAAELKAKWREEDRLRVESGEATPYQVDAGNSAFPRRDQMKILDLSPVFS